MKKNIKISLMGALMATALVACEPSDFGDMNIDPNRPSVPVTSNLLTASQQGLIGPITDSQPTLYSQQISEKFYTENSRYGTAQFSFNGFYSGPLANLELIIQLNTDEATKAVAAQNGANNNQIAVARILKAFMYWHMTDRWGDIPYSQALLGRENFTPVYDSQEAIYNSLFTELKEASAQITSGTIAGDMLLKGNLNLWKKFANTIRLNMALRLSEVSPAKARTEFASAFADGVISSNADNVVFAFLADENNDNPWEDRFQTRLDFNVSKPMVDLLKANNDPRLPIFADKAVLTQEYVGMPYGLEQGAAGAIPNGQVSFLGIAMRRQTSPGYLMTYSQTQFMLAEGALRNWISGDAETFYNEAIKASFDQYGVNSGTVHADYIAQSGVAFDASKGLEQIITQKWVALFLNGYEAWAEWRRTGFPVLTPPASTISPSGIIPTRQGYPTTERDLNGINYNAALQGLGGKDDLDGKVWWDK
ncbi:SusD/RagB family nutrient-binding outer membrane lipoprotein [Arundinibacter roseus]|uniref:SusD/RagB family nutrient-binding outer membrane lipoprotein n=1 Tax=Arundinibacter roseus TaxID=2070510 RepID=A0A4V2X9Y4_9BACT|nr:SusD/RagB family nutrient-binding outer membrane lipoprotein [Arundinibacter roseus]TDB65175.1 SusD/RagB family nutrient-binding outer membrane lipoprotein [Arundinibacter roseus]